MPKIKKSGTFLVAVFFSLFLVAGSVTTSLMEWGITAQNTTTVAVTDAVVPIPLSAQTLTDIGYISADALNAHLHQGSLDTPNMPSSLKIDGQKGYNRALADDTTDAINITTNDMELPYAVGEEYQFAIHNPARIVHLILSTATDYNLTTTWYYCATSNATTCTSWVGFSGVTDTTVDTYAFKNLGTNSISWTVPSAGAWSLENHNSFAAYWLKVRVTAVAAGTDSIVPLGEQSWYETGQWWFHVSNFNAGQTIPYSLYTGGAAIDTYHHYFPGFAGVVTADGATLEPGSDWTFNVRQNLKVDSNETGKIWSKGSTMDLTYVSAAVVGGSNTLTLTAPGVGSAYSGTWTHNEEDGGSYYVNSGEESHSMSFYKGSSNYKTARQVNSADILSNTSSEVVSHKVGQAFDTTTNTTSLFGAKIDDPS